ncbi:hypothetical protein MKX01_023861 [Papaver californicum]|nr:hypothetical protein MKX01_023861 [Papaver californicum]
MAITRNIKASTTPRKNQFNSRGNFVASADNDGTDDIGCRQPKFFQIMHHAIIRDGNLIIPPKFVAKHGADLSHHATLKVPDGLTWDVKLERDSNGGDRVVSFQIARLVPFFEYYSIRAGHVLLFKYHGNSQFHVIIMDISASEIKYPTAAADTTSVDHRQEGNPSETKSSGVEEEDYYVHASTDEDESFASSLSSSSEEEEVRVAEKNKKKHRRLKTKDEDTAMRSTRQRALVIGDEFQSENPFFTIALQSAYVKRKYLMSCSCFNERRLTVGVASLLKDNDLDVGDVIVVELMKEMKSNYLDAKVHIFRA